MEAMLPMREA